MRLAQLRRARQRIAGCGRNAPAPAARRFLLRSGASLESGSCPAVGRRARRPVPCKEAFARRGDESGAGAHCPPQSALQRLLPGGRGIGAGIGKGIRSALGQGPADRPGRWRARHGQGSADHQGLADLARLQGRRSEPELERRCAHRRAAARGRGRAAGQDDDAGIRLEGRDRFPAHRHHPQPVG